MDGQGGFKVIYKHAPDATLNVDFNPDLYSRLPHPDATTESLVASRWKSALERNNKLFNATKFRFAGIHTHDTSIGTYTLRLGLTDYASFVGSHSGSNPLSEFGISHLASPIGNAIITETTDGYIPMLLRNAVVGEGSGYVVFPGGHPEPDEVVAADKDGVRMELWNAARRELIEELFVTDEQVPPANDNNNNDHKFECLGFVSRDHDGKVCQIFRTRVSVDRENVLRQYTAGNIQKEESSDLLFLKKQQVYEDEDILKTKKVEGVKIMPDHLGALQLCKMHLAQKEA